MERIILCFGKFYGGEKNLRIRFQPTWNFKHDVGLGSALSATAVNQQNLSSESMKISNHCVFLFLKSMSNNYVNLQAILYSTANSLWSSKVIYCQNPSS
jgi:hypothetical protein